jgi:hypothetical protein
MIKQLVAITLLMAACYLIFDNINDVNQLPSDVVNECKKIQNELEVINSNSETVKIISTAMLLAIQKINKKNMVSDVEVIKKCFTDYMDILYNKMYEYSYSN